MTCCSNAAISRRSSRSSACRARRFTVSFAQRMTRPVSSICQWVPVHASHLHQKAVVHIRAMVPHERQRVGVVTIRQGVRRAWAGAGASCCPDAAGHIRDSGTSVSSCPQLRCSGRGIAVLLGPGETGSPGLPTIGREALPLLLLHGRVVLLAALTPGVPHSPSPGLTTGVQRHAHATRYHTHLLGYATGHLPRGPARPHQWKTVVLASSSFPPSSSFLPFCVFGRGGRRRKRRAPPHR